MVPVGGGAFGANLGATFWSKDKGTDGVKADKEGLKSRYKTLDRLAEGLVMMNKKALLLLGCPEVPVQTSIALFHSPL